MIDVYQSTVADMFENYPFPQNETATPPTRSLGCAFKPRGPMVLHGKTTAKINFSAWFYTSKTCTKLPTFYRYELEKARFTSR
ncbi:hypothetical protein OK016_05255 [Vibrio chagasii]|nr:hypothetical protein [Vibrio chagasii]